MAFFRKRADPISARSKQLTAQISALEEEIRRLSSDLDTTNTPVSGERSFARVDDSSPKTTAETRRQHVPEQIELKQPVTVAEGDSSAAHFNDLGVRKYDLLGAMRRARTIFSPVAAQNPKLVTYLAAGSVKGLRPLRYEKRIARNRFIFLSVIFVVILWGIAAAFLEYR